MMPEFEKLDSATEKQCISPDAIGDTTSRLYHKAIGGGLIAKPYASGSGSAYYTYEQSRDLLTPVRKHINGGVISQYDYVNDAAGRRTAITRSGSMMSETRTDGYGYNDRNELMLAAKNTEVTEHQYSYDDIGNRMYSFDLGTNRTYTANSLNQYTAIDDFVPQFDLDGNQTRINTSTGIWQVTYNGENRPVLWECGATNIVMKFDRMGRRVEYIETVAGTTKTYHRFVYDGYLCIQRLNAASNNAIDLVFGWDPSEPVATRPLVMQKYGKYNLFYTHDGNKNVSELVFFQQANGIAAHYEYAPFGAVTDASRNTPVTAYDFREYNPFRFSSEYADDTLNLVYYNYRHYDPCVGRWHNRDPIEEEGGKNVYCFVENSPSWLIDFGGLHTFQFNDKGWASGNVSQNNGGVLGVTSFSIRSGSECKCVSGKYSPEYTFVLDIYSMVQDSDDSKWNDDEYGATIRDPRVKSKWNSFWFFESRRRRNLVIEHEERHRQHARKNYDAVIGALGGD